MGIGFRNLNCMETLYSINCPVGLLGTVRSLIAM